MVYSDPDEESECSEDYPIGGMVEPYDIYREDQIMLEEEKK